MAADAAGLSPSFDAFDFRSRATVVAAVSGGSDSLALLFLLRDHLKRAAPAATLLAVSVDHALRRQSATEAADVAALCARYGIAHRTMVWTGAKPATGLAAAARAARYRLLAQAASEAGSDLIAVGHTADDQAETVLMRGARGDGLGLAGMAPATLLDGQVWIVRPLLAIRRQALRDHLTRQGIGWTDDPTNADLRFERPRVRATLAGDDERVEAALREAAAAAARRAALGEAAGALIGVHAALVSPGLVRLAPELPAAADAEAAHALRILLAAMGGTSFLSDERRVRALLMRLRAAPLRMVLSRSLVDRRQAGIFLHREARGLPAAATLADGATWDGRFRIHAQEGSVGVAPVGPETAGKIAPAPGIPASLARAALAAEPQLSGPGSAVRLAPPFSAVLPSFDLAAAQAVAALLGAPKFPPSPWHGHDWDRA